MAFAQRYGLWALVAGASDGGGRAFVEALAQRGLNVAMLARRENLLRELSAEGQQRYGVQTRILAIDLANMDAAQQVVSAIADIKVGFLVYCAGADANYSPFLEAPLAVAEAMLQRNCYLPLQLCHHLAPAMVNRGRGGIVILGSGAGFAGAGNMVVYGASKAFDMVFAEALWCELKPKGVDVLGLILGETDTPALRRLRHKLDWQKRRMKR